MLAAILVAGAEVLEGNLEPRVMTDLAIEVTDDPDDSLELANNLASLKDAVQAGSEKGGRIRRWAMEALDRLELSRQFLERIGKLQEEADMTNQSIAEAIAVCDQSIEKLLLSHLPYLRRETAKAVEPEEDAEELFQEAYFGLRRAAELFDPDRGVRFYGYAAWWIRQTIIRWRGNNSSIIRVPIHSVELYRKIEIFVREVRQGQGRQATLNEISGAVESNVRAVRALLFAHSEPLDFDELMVDQPDDSDSPELTARRLQSCEVIRNQLGLLKEREEQVLRMRFGIDLDTDMTLEEIGQILGVTRERIRQIEVKALTKLRNPTRSRLLAELI